MAQVLSMTPTQGESPEEFAQRVASSIQEFFGEGAPAETPAAETPTDDSAEPAPPEEDTPAEG